MSFKSLSVPSTPDRNGVSTVKRIEIGRIQKIAPSVFPDKLVDVYYRLHSEPSLTLDYSEALAFIAKTFAPERCQWVREDACWWKNQQKEGDPRCLRCSLASAIKAKHGTDLRHQHKPQPGLAYFIAVFSLFGVTAAFSQNMNYHNTRANKDELVIVQLKKDNETLRKEIQLLKSKSPTLPLKHSKKRRSHPPHPR